MHKTRCFSFGDDRNLICIKKDVPRICVIFPDTALSVQCWVLFVCVAYERKKRTLSDFTLKYYPKMNSPATSCSRFRDGVQYIIIRTRTVFQNRSINWLVSIILRQKYLLLPTPHRFGQCLFSTYIHTYIIYVYIISYNT